MPAQQQHLHQISARLVLRNDSIVFSWVMMAIFDIGLVPLTRTMSEVTPNDSTRILWIACLWIVHIWLSIRVFRQHRIRIEIDSTRGMLVKIWILGKKVFYFNQQQVKRIEVVKSEDNDGAICYCCEFEIDQTSAIRIDNNSKPQVAERTAEKLRAAVAMMR
jgi:hypothetical protein